MSRSRKYELKNENMRRSRTARKMMKCNSTISSSSNHD
jgi:hypothetical protein